MGGDDLAVELRRRDGDGPQVGRVVCYELGRDDEGLVTEDTSFEAAAEPL